MAQRIDGSFSISSESKRCKLSVNAEWKDISPQMRELLECHGAEINDGKIEVRLSLKTALALACLLSDELYL